MTGTDRHLVVDGSNIATEGRSLPSLAQLVEAVKAIDAEYEYESLTVIVDATFAHRIDDSEKEEFEAAVTAGEIVAPPAGAIGRGDAFILQVASKVGAVVFSNDSFQEFHGEHEWLFEQGRLIGGKPIGGVGWVFVERAPVRGPTSRRAVREAEGRSGRSRPRSTRSRSRSTSAKGPAPKPTVKTPPPSAKSTAPARGNKKDTGRSKAAGTASTKSPQKNVEELNDARSFMSFVSSYSIGDEAEAVVERFSSHGCYLRAATARCYLPSRAMGDPPPSRARDVVSQGQSLIVKVESLDADRRGINVSLVRVIEPDGAEAREKANQADSKKDSRATRARRRNPANFPQDSDAVADDPGREGYPTRRATTVATKKPAKKAAAKKSTAKKAVKKTAARKAPAKKTTAKKAVKKTAARGAAKKAPAKKAAAKKTTTKKAAKKAPAKKAAAKKTAKKAPARKTAKKTAAKATSSARVQRATAKKTAKKAPAKKAAAKKAPARKTAAKKAPAKKAAAKKATAKKATKK
ncbi:MAG: hypothetical protein AAFN30_06880 [Actinomycetota bacterium]